MNFLDPDEWTDLESLAKEYEELTEDLVHQLHARLKPYFLRRIKSDVLQLPPKVSEQFFYFVCTVLSSRSLERSYCSCFDGTIAKGDLSVNP